MKTFLSDIFPKLQRFSIPFVSSGEIKDITFEDCIYIKPEIHNTMLKSSQLKKGDLLIAIVGSTIGRLEFTIIVVKQTLTKQLHS